MKGAAKSSDLEMCFVGVFFYILEMCTYNSEFNRAITILTSI